MGFLLHISIISLPIFRAVFPRDQLHAGASHNEISGMARAVTDYRATYIRSGSRDGSQKKTVIKLARWGMTWTESHT